MKAWKRKFRKDTESQQMYIIVLLKSRIWGFFVHTQPSVLSRYFMALCLCLFELLNMHPDKSVNKITSLYLICTLRKLKVCIKLFLIFLPSLAKAPP